MSMTKRPYIYKFRKVWLTDTYLKDWLEEVENDDTICRCKVCNIILKPRLSRLQDHPKSAIHLRNLKLYNNPSKTREEIDSSYDDLIKKFEIKAKPLKRKSIVDDGAKRLKSCTQKFRKTWLSDTNFQGWLEEDMDDGTKYRCKVCDMVLEAKLPIIRKHLNSTDHLRNIELYNASKFLEEANIKSQTKTKPEEIISNEDANIEFQTMTEPVEIISNDWKNVCVVCLQKNWRNLRSIFIKDFDGLMISDKISECSTLQIQMEMNIPHNICGQCYRDLQVAYRFRKNCEKSNRTLEEFILNTNCPLETVEGYMEIEPENNSEDNCDYYKMNSLSEPIQFKAVPKEHRSEIPVPLQDDENEINSLSEPLQIVNLKVVPNGRKSEISVSSEDEGDYFDMIGVTLENDDFYIKENDTIDNYDESESDNFKTHSNDEGNCTDGKPNFKCGVCGKLYLNHFILKIHMKTHKIINQE